MLQFYNRLVKDLFPKSNNSTMLFPAVYGIRAIAIIFIVLGVFNIPYISGGSLGYSILFVVSGYLFTDSILNSVEKESKVNLKKFYKNRAIKIFPSLLAMLLVFGILLAIFRRELMPVMRTNFLPGIFQFENWWQILKYQGSEISTIPISHLWALSLIVQLAIVWPLILWALYNFSRDERWPIIVAGVLAFLSIILMVIFYSAEHPIHGTVGTDTRAFSFFIGAGLACYTGNPRDRIWKYPVFIVDILGGISLIGIIAVLLFAGSSKLEFISMNIAISFFTACILLSAFRPSSVLARILGFAPLSIIGKSAYGIYLWHLPFVMLLGLEDGGKWWLIIIAAILISIFAGLSSRFIEGPIRRGVIEDTYRIIDSAPRSTYEKQEYKRAIKRARITLISLLALLLVSSLCIAGVSQEKKEGEVSEVEETSIRPSENNESVVETTSNTPKSFNDTNTLFIGDEYVLVVHDSLIDNIPNITVDIAGSRYSTSAGPIYEAYANGGWKGEIVIISLSNTGELYDSLEDIRGRMKDNQLLFIINNRGSEWEQGNNSKISDFVNSNEQSYAVDWYGASENHPEYFDSNSWGLSEEGIKIYTELIQTTVNAALNSQ